MKKINQVARQWRSRNPERTSGVVLIWRGHVYGWKNCLRDPQHEQPGSFAVDDDGCVYVATGGDPYNGAHRWEPVK